MLCTQMHDCILLVFLKLYTQIMVTVWCLLLVVRDCNRLSAYTRFLQTGNTRESCSKRLAQALYSDDNHA